MDLIKSIISSENIKKGKIKIFLDKRKRKKIVTILSELSFIPLENKKELVKKLKIICASGAIYDNKEDIIEIRGSFIEKVCKFLKENNYNYEIK